jgi:hypothetical protein
VGLGRNSTEIPMRIEIIHIRGNLLEDKVFIIIAFVAYDVASSEMKSAADKSSCSYLEMILVVL